MIQDTLFRFAGFIDYNFFFICSQNNRFLLFTLGKRNTVIQNKKLTWQKINRLLY